MFLRMTSIGQRSRDEAGRVVGCTDRWMVCADQEVSKKR
jgi:hypothetical protein